MLLFELRLELFCSLSAPFNIETLVEGMSSLPGAVSGVLGGLCAVSVMHPIDVAQKRIQVKQSLLSSVFILCCSRCKIARCRVPTPRYWTRCFDCRQRTEWRRCMMACCWRISPALSKTQFFSLATNLSKLLFPLFRPLGKLSLVQCRDP